ncbi:carbohydrate kinase [Cellulomonas sp. APG4]|uniref:PfkB family carbohydrate kinase n=1 Tax=Cellulomonas sp. APG4 TaxID=1538656 RepID=UPI00137B5BB1|nr:PfkB family carbohydrate kinase [Cellulomonas sp. APG4]NCT92166.1 carbohydrate kinase [Cellulomonas sp. APG4]
MPERQATRRHVVCCGLTTLDVVQHVDHVPGPDEKVVARDLWVAAGGPAANAAVTAAALGARATLVTRIGDGPVADLVRADLRAHGVEVHDLAGPGATPAVSTVLVTTSTGERAVVSVNATGRPDVTADGGVATTDLPDGVARTLAACDALLVDGHHLDLALAAARRARDAGAPVLLDGGSWKPGLERLLAVVDVAVLSAAFRAPAALPAPGGPDDDAAPSRQARDPDGAGLLRAVRRAGPRLVARSQGGGPIQVLADDDPVDGRLLEVRVPEVPVRDTLGAGDVLHGAALAWLAQRPATRPLDAPALADGLARAAEVASWSCRTDGARGWLADHDAVGRLAAHVRG